MSYGIVYTVGVADAVVQPRFVDYRVTSHVLAHGALTLDLDDGTRIHYPSLAGKIVKLYPDFRLAEEKICRLRDEVRYGGGPTHGESPAAYGAPPPPAAPPLSDDEFQNLLRAQAAKG